MENVAEVGTGKVLAGLAKRTARDIGLKVITQNCQTYEDIKEFWWGLLYYKDEIEIKKRQDSMKNK